MAVDAPSVLVVEDEASQLEVLTYNLEAEGYRVTKAETGDKALLLFDEVRPDLVLLDWMLPGVSGIEVCRQLKANAATRKVPVIMLSARSEEVDRLRSMGKITLPTSLGDELATNPFLRTREATVIRAAKTINSEAAAGITTMAAIRAWKDRF